MQSRKPVKAALVNQIDAVRLRILLLQAEVCTGSGPNRKSWHSGYELKAKKEHLVRLETVLADYPSGPTQSRSLGSEFEGEPTERGAA
jgi:hypothetical protein